MAVDPRDNSKAEISKGEGADQGAPVSGEAMEASTHGSDPSSTTTGTRRLQLTYTQMLALPLTKAR